MQMEMVEYKGWAHCLRLANREIELIVTTDVGPRIMRAGFIGAPNLFKNVEDQMGLTGGEQWRLMGGHRLWHAPEVYPRTYAPDNAPVDYEMRGDTLVLRQPIEPTTGLEKHMEITLDPQRNTVSVNHVIINRGVWAVEVAAWTLSVMAPGGRMIIPQEEYRPHPDYLVPARPLVLWHFTDMSDPRWTWGRRFIQLRQDSTATTKQKAGVLNKQQWVAYHLGEQLMLKRYPYDPRATYADHGCNTEAYTDPHMLEVETLGPLKRLEPGESLSHPETWSFEPAAAQLPTQEDELAAALAPALAKLMK